MMQRLRDLLSAVSFHRGLALGALVGSAIAGSTIWARIRPKRTHTRVGPEWRSATIPGDAEPRSGA